MRQKLNLIKIKNTWCYWKYQNQQLINFHRNIQIYIIIQNDEKFLL